MIAIHRTRQMLTLFVNRHRIFQLSLAHPAREPNELENLLDTACEMYRQENFDENSLDFVNLLRNIDNVLMQNPHLINVVGCQFSITPMHIAADLGIPSLVQLLAEYQPDLSLRNSLDQTPIDRARACENPEIADYLEGLELGFHYQ